MLNDVLRYVANLLPKITILEMVCKKPKLNYVTDLSRSELKSHPLKFWILPSHSPVSASSL